MARRRGCAAQRQSRSLVRTETWKGCEGIAGWRATVEAPPKLVRFETVGGPSAIVSCEIPSRRDVLADHEPVAVRRAQTKLAHSPRLFAQVLQNLGARRDRFTVVGGDIVDSEIRDIAVVSELACRWDIGAAAQHERDPARAAERPIPRINFVDLTAEHVSIPRSGSFEVMNCENGIGPHDRHGPILSQAGTVVPSRVERSGGSPGDTRSPRRSLWPPASQRWVSSRRALVEPGTPAGAHGAMPQACILTS